MGRTTRPDLVHGLLAGGRAGRQATATVQAALLEARGNAVQAAHELGVSHRTLLRWLKRHPELRAARVRAARLPAMQTGQGSYDTDVIGKARSNRGTPVTHDTDVIADAENATKDALIAS